MCIILLGGISLGISGVLATLAPLPQPQFHDEFSYLLAADTFALGRLTNPTHELWKFFETFRVIQQPTYQSMYQPGQGLILALGQILSHRIIGIWLTTAVATAAAYWSMRAFTSKRWALLGAVIVMTHPLVLRWNWSYWGGTLPMLGGMLVVGAVGRLRSGARVSSGLMLGLGVSILLLTRPFEGAILVVLGGLLLAGRTVAPRVSRRSGRGSAAVAATVVMVAAIGFQLYYNFRVVRSAWTLPYQVYESQYAIFPPLVWLPRREQIPDYFNTVMREYYLNWELPEYVRQHTLRGFAAAGAEKLWEIASAYLLSIGLIVPLLTIPFVWRRDRMLRRAVTAAGLFTLLMLSHYRAFPHYTAPAAGLYLLVVVCAMRHLKRWLVVLVLVLQIALSVWFAVNLVRRESDGWSFQRAELIEQLKQSDEKHLVIVRYPPGASTHNEWVYNAADIDDSPVVWARDRGAIENRELLEYFSGRRVWLLEVGVQFRPYE